MGAEAGNRGEPDNVGRDHRKARRAVWLFYLYTLYLTLFTVGLAAAVVWQNVGLDPRERAFGGVVVLLLLGAIMISPLVVVARMLWRGRVVGVKLGRVAVFPAMAIMFGCAVIGLSPLIAFSEADSDLLWFVPTGLLGSAWGAFLAVRFWFKDLEAYQWAREEEEVQFGLADDGRLDVRMPRMLRRLVEKKWFAPLVIAVPTLWMGWSIFDGLVWSDRIRESEPAEQTILAAYRVPYRSWWALAEITPDGSLVQTLQESDIDGFSDHQWGTEYTLTTQRIKRGSWRRELISIDETRPITGREYTLNGLTKSHLRDERFGYTGPPFECETEAICDVLQSLEEHPDWSATVKVRHGSSQGEPELITFAEIESDEQRIDAGHPTSVDAGAEPDLPLLPPDPESLALFERIQSESVVGEVRESEGVVQFVLTGMEAPLFELREEVTKQCSADPAFHDADDPEVDPQNQRTSRKSKLLVFDGEVGRVGVQVDGNTTYAWFPDDERRCARPAEVELELDKFARRVANVLTRGTLKLAELRLKDMDGEDPASTKNTGDWHPAEGVESMVLSRQSLKVLDAASNVLLEIEGPADEDDPIIDNTVQVLRAKDGRLYVQAELMSDGDHYSESVNVTYELWEFVDGTPKLRIRSQTEMSLGRGSDDSANVRIEHEKGTFSAFEKLVAFEFESTCEELETKLVECPNGDCVSTDEIDAKRRVQWSGSPGFEFVAHHTLLRQTLLGDRIGCGEP